MRCPVCENPVVQMTDGVYCCTDDECSQNRFVLGDLGLRKLSVTDPTTSYEFDELRSGISGKDTVLID
jgi:hypothetical protein